MKIFIVVIIFIVPQISIAQAFYSLLVDDTFSSQTGGENILTAYKFINTVEDQYFRAKYFHEDNFFKKSAGVLLRIGYAGYVDYFPIKIATTIQHEVFGHGALAREIGNVYLRYDLSLPYIYDKEHSYTFFRFLKSPTSHERLALYYSGTQANSILANIIKDKSIENGVLSYQMAHLYLRNFHNITRYIYRTDPANYIPGNDMMTYIGRLNFLYLNNNNFKPTKEIRINDLKRNVLLNLFDPFQFISFYVYLKTFIWDGKSSRSIPIIRLFNIKFLPGVRFGLTPFGMERSFENYILYRKRMLKFIYNYGIPTFERFWGAGFHIANAISTESTSIGLATDVWHQPRLALSNSNNISNNAYGGAVKLTIHQKLYYRCIPVFMTMQLGYKTDGFLFGEKLKRGVIFRVGFSVRK